MVNKISVIIPVFNVKKELLVKSVNSVINQTYRNLEIIVVDDGSEPSCASVCDEFAKSDSRIKVIHQSNQGLAGARYSGLKQATCEYVMFLDGDDFLDPTTCQKAVEIVNLKKVDVVLFGLVLDYNKSQVKQKMDFNKREFSLSEMPLLEKKVLDIKAHVSSAVAKLINKKVLLGNKEFSNTQLRQGAEDLVFSLLLFHYARSAYVINEYLYHYVYNPSSITRTFNEKNHILLIDCYKFINNFLVQTRQTNLLTDLYSRVIYSIIAVGVSGYFSPTNSQSYFQKKQGYRRFLSDPFVVRSIKGASKNGLSFQRKILLFCAKHKIFLPFLLAGKMRVIQLGSK